MQVHEIIPSVEEQRHALERIHYLDPNHPIREEFNTAIAAQKLAIPRETVEMERQASYMYTAMMAPSRDGIYVIGSVPIKTGGTHSTSTIGSGSNWGF